MRKKYSSNSFVSEVDHTNISPPVMFLRFLWFLVHICQGLQEGLANPTDRLQDGENYPGIGLVFLPHSGHQVVRISRPVGVDEENSKALIDRYCSMISLKDNKNYNK